MSDDEVESPCVWQSELNNYGIDEWGCLNVGEGLTRKKSYTEQHNPYARPWTQPGADINQWFNFGFTEETWLGYCTE